MLKQLLFALLIGVLAVGCTTTRLAPIEFVKFTESPTNGLRVEGQTDNLTYTLQYRPLPYVAVMEHKQPQIPETLVDKRVKELTGMHYFLLRMQSNTNNADVLNFQSASLEDYQNRVSYFSFDFRNDLQLVDGQDTLSCKLYHFERRYGVTPYVEFMLGFPAADSAITAHQDKTLLIKNRVFGHRPLPITIQKDAINRVPQLLTQPRA